MDLFTLYSDYVMLRYGGLDHTQTMQHFSYLPSNILVQFARHISAQPASESYVSIVDIAARKEQAALENTQPSIKL
jgi:hypothetical protein